MKNIFSSLCLLVIAFQFSAYSQNNSIKDDWANLKKYAEADSILNIPATGEHRIVFMGNSITEFWVKLDSSFFANPEYIGRGISGQTSSQMLLRFRQDVINLKPTVVAILAGTNDIAENAGHIALNDILGNIISMTELAKFNNIKVILCSVPPTFDFPWHPGLQPAEKIVKLNSMIKFYCEENNIPYVDYYSKLVDDRMGFDKDFSNDGVHPNLAGYQVMDTLVVQAVNLAIDSVK
jgi:lysophospholipase L1-like esterase